MPQTLCFNDVQFDVIPQNSQPWIRGSQIATALQYASVQRVIELYTRHADEFTGAMTAVIKLPSEGGEQETRIFSLRGCHLLAMFARTPVAKAFRRWVLDVLDRLAAEERAAHRAPSITITTPSTGAERRELHALVTREWCPRSGMHNYECWQKLNAHLGLKSIMDLPRERIGEAMSWVRAQIEGHVSPAPSGHAHLPVSKTDLCTLPVQASHLPKLHTLFKDIQRAAECLALSENWTHLAVRFELGDAAAPAAKHAVDMHVNAAWYALGLARSSLLAAVAVGKPALA